MNDVYSFISGIPTCSEYAQVGARTLLCALVLFSLCPRRADVSCDFTLQTFKDHMIDGETLPLLSEEHLLDTLGLKLGPALKIRSQVRNAASD